MGNELSLQQYYESRKSMIDKAVKEFLEKEGLLEVSETPLGGKRLRGVLVSVSYTHLTLPTN